jgi:hypothetical protein
MNYDELTDKFWKFNQKRPIGATAIALYLFLLKIWNEKGNDFMLTNKEICNTLKITERTIIPTKEKLRNLGLISYQTPEKTKIGVGTHYKIIYDYSIIEEEKKQKQAKKGTVKKEKETENNNKLHLLIDKQEQQKELENYFPQKAEIQKTIKLPQAENQVVVNKNETSTSVKIPEIKPISLTLEEKEKIPTTQEIVKNPKIINKNIPELEEFMAFAQTIEIYQESFNFQIKTKYESWLNDGWKDGFGKNITNWQQKLKKTMPYFSISSGQGKNGFSSARDSIPSIKRPKPTYNE